jgi:predicted lipoprotein with Yx(FWY)xxD motif
MTNSMKRSALVLTSALFLASAAQAASMLTDKNGMTLYVFDKDVGGVSACYDACAAKWPPYLGQAHDKMTEGWTLVKRTDDKLQWAYDGKPVYFFEGDKKKGDKAGDNMGNVWHIIVE